MLNKILAAYFRSFLYRLWLGEYRLWVSFWLFFLVGQYVVVLLILIIAAPLAYFFGFMEILAVLILLLAVYLLYVFIATVGTWRSSDKYTDSDAIPKVTKILLSLYGGYLLIFLLSFPYLFDLRPG